MSTYTILDLGESQGRGRERELKGLKGLRGQQQEEVEKNIFFFILKNVHLHLKNLPVLLTIGLVDTDSPTSSERGEQGPKSFHFKLKISSAKLMELWGQVLP